MATEAVKEKVVALEKEKNDLWEDLNWVWRWWLNKGMGKEEDVKESKKVVLGAMFSLSVCYVVLCFLLHPIHLTPNTLFFFSFLKHYFYYNIIEKITKK